MSIAVIPILASKATTLLPRFFLPAILFSAIVPVSAAADAPREMLQDRLAAAEKAYRLAASSDLAGQSDIETIYRWSCRWMEAQRATGPGKENRASAAQAHLNRMRELAQSTRKQVDAGLKRPFDQAAVQYFIAEATIWVAEAKRD